MTDHLDAEILAAWLDGALDPHERAAAEAHAADCDRCRAVLAAMVRTEPPPVRQAWFGSRAVRWAIPLAAAAAALLVWNFTVSNPRAPEIQSQQARREPAIAPPAATPEPPAVSTSARPAEPIDRLSRSQAKPSAGAATPAPTAETANRKDAPAAVTSEERARRERAADAAAPPAGPPAAVAPPVAAPLPQTAAPPPPPPATQPTARMAAPAGSGTQLRVAVAGTARQVIAAPGGAQWLLGVAGLIQHSADGGKTWTAQASGVTVDLLAGSAPSADAVWIVGRAGVVLLSTDGKTWRRVAFPQAVDLTRVSATSAQAAAVTTADGRVFRTTDGGKTWERQP